MDGRGRRMRGSLRSLPCSPDLCFWCSGIGRHGWLFRSQVGSIRPPGCVDDRGWRRRGAFTHRVHLRDASYQIDLSDANLVVMKLIDLIWLGHRLVDTGRLETQARARGIPTAEFIVMRSLLEDSPTTITALANRTGYAQRRTSTAVSDLVKRGWAYTGSDPADGR